MADIELKVLGDASGAAAALGEASSATEELGDAQTDMAKKTDVATKSVEQQEKEMANLKAGLVAVTALAVKFGAEAVKAYADAERIQKQLARVAGELTGAFEAQADALEQQLAVDGEVIKQQQAMLLQWGAAPSAIEGTIRAIEDYAAFTGKDAVQATEELIRGVESGGAAFAKLGIHYEATGNKSEDLRRLTAALQEQFVGAAASDASGLTGGIRAAEIAFGNLQEAFGGVIGTVESKFGVLEKMTTLLRGLTKEVQEGGVLGALRVAGDFAGGGVIGRVAGSMIADAAFGKETPETPSITDTTPRGGTGGKTNRETKREASAQNHADEMWKIAKKNADDLRALMKEEEAFDMEQLSRDEDRRAKEIDGLWKLAAEEQRIEGDRLESQKALAKKEDDFWLDKEKKTAAHIEKLRKAESDAESKAAEEAVERTKAMEDRSRQAADAIGAAFVNALADQLAKLADGGELDPAIFIGEILAATVGTAATIIGTAYGAPAVGAAIGNLAAMGIRAGASGISKQSKRAKTYHSGGWVGDEIDIPRHHSGAWIGADERAAVLQTGERVLSRVEVGAMGGNGAVDAAAEGRRPGVTVNVTALDSKSAAEAFESQVGRGLQRALNSGRGALPALLGGVR